MKSRSSDWYAPAVWMAAQAPPVRTARIPAFSRASATIRATLPMLAEAAIVKDASRSSSADTLAWQLVREARPRAGKGGSGSSEVPDERSSEGQDEKAESSHAFAPRSVRHPRDSSELSARRTAASETDAQSPVRSSLRAARGPGGSPSASAHRKAMIVRPLLVVI